MRKKLLLLTAFMLTLTACKPGVKDGDTKTTDDKKIVSEVDKDEQKEKEELEKDSEKIAELISFNVKREDAAPIYPEFKDVEYTATSKPYDFAEFFKSLETSNDEDIKWVLKNERLKNSLKENGFGVVYGIFEQPFAIYDQNQYTYSNSFITTDSAMHLFHVIYLGMMEELETGTLRDKLTNLSIRMYENSLKNYNEGSEETKPYALKNAALFYTGLKILNDGAGIDAPAEVKELASKELQNIEGEAAAVSNITENEVDYSQFKPRGNYTKSEELKTYFKANMLYSQNKFVVRDNTGAVNKENLKSTIVMTDGVLKDKKSYDLWLQIYNPISFLVENSEDLTPIGLYEMISKHASSFDLNEMLKDDVIEGVSKEIQAMEGPSIKPQDGVTFGFLPQRAVIDNVWLQNLLENTPDSRRPLASGLDVMAVMGNETAEKRVTTDEKNLLWPDFLDKFEETKAAASNMGDKEKSNIYRAWLWMLRANNQDYKDGYPFFMQSDLWKIKDLNSSLASWAQLKHDTILYAKQFGAEMGGFDERKTYNYVEPNIDLYNRLIWITDFTLENSDKYNLLDESRKEVLKSYKDMLQFFIEVSKKELNDENITDEENERMATIAGEMENIFIAFDKAPEEEFSVPASERNMTNVADIQDVGKNSVGIPVGHKLEVGSGRFSTIYTIYRFNGEYKIGSGAIMNYYEFLSPTRLTDEEMSEKIEKTFFGDNAKDAEVNPFFKDLFIPAAY